MTLKVRRNSPGAPSLSAFTTPRSTPGSSRRNSKDVTAESSSSSNSSSPTMFRKLRQKRSQKEKRTEIVLYKGVILIFFVSLITNNYNNYFYGLILIYDLTSTQIVIVFDFIVSLNFLK